MVRKEGKDKTQKEKKDIAKDWRMQRRGRMSVPMWMLLSIPMWVLSRDRKRKKLKKRDGKFEKT